MVELREFAFASEIDMHGARNDGPVDTPHSPLQTTIIPAILLLKASDMEERGNDHDAEPELVRRMSRLISSRFSRGPRIRG
ncbi:hypothetical protein [Polyangium sorediatum]|uniref:Uncharacterized protein n=1 Tax=Polyangium sorediatum TaxID=889274 RepID=A0ABT6NWK2_9BACT|nr:hypothetical protein [Polyangium sorediatum]MDI1432688.1 hypothetical protein [Polyangium sorediatum]